MIPLTRQQVARILKLTCEQHDCSPQYVLQHLPWHIQDNAILDRVGSIYYLSKITAALPAGHMYPYIIRVDTCSSFSQSSLRKARALANKLCIVYPLAREISIECHGCVLERWKRISVSEWIQH